MECIIQLVRTPLQQYQVTVRLPNKWLALFADVRSVQVFDWEVGPQWGGPYYEDDQLQPWRFRTQVFATEAWARAKIQEVQGDLRAAVRALQPFAPEIRYIPIGPDPSAPLDTADIPATVNDI